MKLGLSQRRQVHVSRRRALRALLGGVTLVGCSIRKLLLRTRRRRLFRVRTRRSILHNREPKKCSPVKLRSLPLKRSDGDRALPFEKPNHPSDRRLVGMAHTVCTWSGYPCPSIIWHSFCRASAWKIAPSCRRACPRWPSAVVRGRRPHDTCSPTWSGIGFGKDPTINPPLVGHQAT